MLVQLGRGLSTSNASNAINSTITDTTSKTIALIGDSLTAQNTSANDQEYLPQGYMGMLNAISGQRYDFLPSHNLGVSGDSISQVKNRMTDLANLSPAPDIVFVLGGTNDIPAGTTASSMQNDLQAIYDYIINTIGAKVIALTIPPRTQFPSGDALTTAQQTKLTTVNNWIKSLGGDITPVDVYDILADGSDLPIASNFNKEGTSSTAYVHPNPLGAYNMANTVLSALSTQYGTYQIPDMSTNNLLSNPDMSGTSGSNSSNLTGDIADNCTLYAYTAATGTVSKPLANTQQINISYTNSTSYDTMQFSQADITSGYTPGDNVIGEAEIEILSSSNLEGIWIEVTDVGGSSLLYKGLSKYDDPEFPNTPQTYYFKTPIIPTQIDSTTLKVKVRAELNSAGGQTAHLNCNIKQMRCKILS